MNSLTSLTVRNNLVEQMWSSLREGITPQHIRVRVCCAEKFRTLFGIRYITFMLCHLSVCQWERNYKITLKKFSRIKKCLRSLGLLNSWEKVGGQVVGSLLRLIFQWCLHELFKSDFLDNKGKATISTTWKLGTGFCCRSEIS